MLNYRKLNNIGGWTVFLLSFIVYALTVEPTASFWDCGEFIAGSYKLQIVHPPGAPLFLLVGRFFSMFNPLFGGLEAVPVLLNFVSVVSSALTIMFLFWTISLLGRKLVLTKGNVAAPTSKILDKPDANEKLSANDVWKILGSAFVGAMAFTFTDSFWWSAVEAEVYAMSSFFTAFVFWAMLRWQALPDRPENDRWLLLIAYMMGLSIGVHLLNLVAIPALVFIYYFKKYEITRKGVLVTLLISAGILGVILIGIIPGLPSVAKRFELIFVNSFGLPFGSGAIFFLLLIAGLLAYFIWYSIKKENRVLNVSLLALTFILIGYSSYAIIFIRSSYDPPIDMNDPEDVMAFEKYVKREQYGDRPLLRGAYYTADYSFTKGDKRYILDEEKGEYVAYNRKTDIEYNDDHKAWFVRMYSTRSPHPRIYESYVGKPEVRVGTDRQGNPVYRPSFLQNLQFFFEYQIGHMYLRYFGWNFIGREHDIQDAGSLGPADWFSDTELPDYMKRNEARNNFFAIPFILGIIGLWFHFKKDPKGGTLVAMLFFFTGIAIIIYLNQPPVEPRERDYTFVGSFYAFSIWIGLAVMAFADRLGQKVLKSAKYATIAGICIALLAPGILAAVGWDDHDRSERYHSTDSAKNLLSSCAPNAILFTGGDNDTYPLWYVQEVEGFRTDVRVCNLSLLNTDWYIRQMKRQAYKSEPLPITLEEEDYLEGINDQMFVQEHPKGYKANVATLIRLIKEKDQSIMTTTSTGDPIPVLPSKKFYFKNNRDLLSSEDLSYIPENVRDSIPEEFEWEMPDASIVSKQTLIIMDILAHNNWERPVYFSTSLSSSDYMNLWDYFQLEGLAYRLLPAKITTGQLGRVDTETMADNMFNKFRYRNLDNPGVYYDENFRRFALILRRQLYKLSEAFLAEGNKERAAETIQFSLEKIPDISIPYDIAVSEYPNILFSAGKDSLALEITHTMGNRVEENLAYLQSENRGYGSEYQENFIILYRLINYLRAHNYKDEAARLDDLMNKYPQQRDMFYRGAFGR